MIDSKLDRVSVNGEWLAQFPLSDANFFLSSISKHSLSIIHVGNALRGFSKPFKFFNMWTQHGDFLKVVKEGWNIQVEDDPLYMLVQKLKNVKVNPKW